MGVVYKKVLGKDIWGVKHEKYSSYPERFSTGQSEKAI